MCRRYITYKTVVILQPVKLGYMFRPLPSHHQANKEIVCREPGVRGFDFHQTIMPG